MPTLPNELPDTAYSALRPVTGWERAMRCVIAGSCAFCSAESTDPRCGCSHPGRCDCHSGESPAAARCAASLHRRGRHTQRTVSQRAYRRPPWERPANKASSRAPALAGRNSSSRKAASDNGSARSIPTLRRQIPVTVLGSATWWRPGKTLLQGMIDAARTALRPHKPCRGIGPAAEAVCATGSRHKPTDAAKYSSNSSEG